VRASSTITLSVVAVVLLAACGDSTASESSVAVKAKITISSTTDPTNEMIAEIYGQALEKAEFRVARKKPYATSDELFAAMKSGDVQLAATTTLGLLALLSADGSTTTSPPPTATLLQTDAITKALPANLKISATTTAEDKDVVYCATTFTDANTIATLTDLGTKPGLATLAAPDGFDTSTPLGAAALKDTYGIEFKSIVPAEVGHTLEPVAAGTADCGVGRSGDPALAVATVTILQDDKALVPNDVILPLVSADAGTIDVTSVLDATSARLTPNSLRALVAALAADGASPESVANAFIGNAGT
jgi:osmoprotectant transport system substrate-binding protein